VWFTDAGLPADRLNAEVAATVRMAFAARRVPVLVAYAIPLRDCGGASSGGAASGAAYDVWVQAFAAGLRAGGASDTSRVAVVLEPDALGQLDQLPQVRQSERLELLRAATQTMSTVPGVAVYLDAGHSGWIAPAEMVARLSAAGVAAARGFSLNVSNYRRTEEEVAYGREMAPQLGWKSFVVDTSRNGSGPASDEEWCNPPGRALGPPPQPSPSALVDAHLWVKSPGESDGSCRPGQPAAGEFWPDYADELSRNAGW
jgi:endoglucanase